MSCKYPAIMAVAVLLAVAFVAVIPADAEAADADYNIVGEIISVEELPTELQEVITNNALGAYAIKYDYVKEIAYDEDKVFNIAYNYSTPGTAFGTITVDAYAMGFNAAGEKETYGGDAIITIDETAIISSAVESGGETFPIPADLTQAALTGDNVGGSLFVLLVSNAPAPAGLVASVEIMYGTEVVSNKLLTSVPGTDVITINGVEADATIYNVPVADVPVDFIDNFAKVTVQPGSNIESINLAVLLHNDSAINEAQKAAISNLVKGERYGAFYIEFNEAAGMTANPGAVSLEIHHPINVSKDERLAIAYIATDGTVDKTTASIDNGVVTFEHNSMYVVYVEDVPKADSGLATAIGAFIAVICVIAAVLSIVLIKRE